MAITTPAEFREWLLYKIDRIAYWLQPMSHDEIPEGVEIIQTDEEWPGPDPDIRGDAADVALEAAEIGLRFGLADLYRECHDRAPRLSITTAKEMLGRFLHACYQLPPDMTVGSPRNGEDETDKEPKSTLSRIHDRAYLQYTEAQKALGARTTDKRAYQWLRGHNEDNMRLPSFPTWCRYLREARKHNGTQKNSPRAGRTGGSIVSIHDIKDARNDDDDSG